MFSFIFIGVLFLIAFINFTKLSDVVITGLLTFGGFLFAIFFIFNVIIVYLRGVLI